MEYYPEHSGRDSVDLAGKGYLSQYGNSGLHLLDELVVIRPVHSDLILFLVIILGTEKSIDYRAVVGEKYKSRRILIKSPDGEYPFRIANVIDYVGRISAVCSASNAERLIEGYVDIIGLRNDVLAVNKDNVITTDLHTGFSYDAVNRHAAFLDESVGFSP
jgi:hypothetical protein